MGSRRRASGEVPPARPPLQLVGPRVSEDTVSALESLLARSRAGEIVGIAYVAMQPGRTYLADTAGVARRDLTYTLGAITALARLVAAELVDLGR